MWLFSGENYVAIGAILYSIRAVIGIQCKSARIVVVCSDFLACLTLRVITMFCTRCSLPTFNLQWTRRIGLKYKDGVSTVAML